VKKAISGLVIRVAIGEEVTFSGNIKLVVIAVRRKEAILTIEAPPEIKIDREFRHDKKKFKEAIR